MNITLVIILLWISFLKENQLISFRCLLVRLIYAFSELTCKTTIANKYDEYSENFLSFHS